MTAAEDRELVGRLLGSDPAAWERFTREFGPLLTRAAASVARQAAEDVAQKVFAALLDHDLRLLRSFRGLSSLSTWLGGIARRMALELLRKERPRELPPRPPQPGPLEQLLQAESEAQVVAALDTLPPRERLILQLHYKDGLPYAEIAAFLAVAVNSVGPLLDRARSRLKTVIGHGTTEPTER